jgi:hypothetical protein
MASYTYLKAIEDLGEVTHDLEKWGIEDGLSSDRDTVVQSATVDLSSDGRFNQRFHGRRIEIPKRRRPIYHLIRDQPRRVHVRPAPGHRDRPVDCLEVLRELNLRLDGCGGRPAREDIGLVEKPDSGGTDAADPAAQYDVGGILRTEALCTGDVAVGDVEDLREKVEVGDGLVEGVVLPLVGFEAGEISGESVRVEGTIEGELRSH